MVIFKSDFIVSDTVRRYNISINLNLKVRRSMRNKYLKQLIYVVIPIITVFLCRLLKVAQGEKNEEIVFGIMLGILLDIIFFIIQK